MRLTLRILLAHMDENLSPEDASIIEQKITGSEYATALRKKIQDVSRHPTLPAPSVTDHSGQNAGIQNANATAEYLDNEMPEEAVKEFEKVCLASDMMLAEITCCHQILNLVLREPADVDPEIRLKMYKLAADQERAVQTGRKAEENDFSDILLSAPVPVSRSQRLLRAIIGACMILLVLWGAGRMMPGSSYGRFISHFLPGIPDESTDTEEKSDISDVPKMKNIESSDISEPEKKSDTKPVESVENSVPDTSDKNSSKNVSVSEQPISDRDPSDPYESAPPKNEVGTLEAEVEEKTPSSADTESPIPVVPGVESISDSRSKPEENVMKEASSVPAESPLPEKKNSTELSEVPMGESEKKGWGLSKLNPTQMARVESDNAKVLVVSNKSRDNDSWVRALGSASIPADSLITSFPSYDTTVKISDQILITMMDGAQMKLNPVESMKNPSVTLIFGKFRIIASSTAGSDDMEVIHVHFPNNPGTLILNGADSDIALEVYRELGNVTPERKTVGPEDPLHPVRVNLYVLKNFVSFQVNTLEEPFALKGPCQLSLDRQPLNPTRMQNSEFPTWLGGTKLPDSVVRASRILATRLGTRPLEQTLLEISDEDTKNRDLNWLAVRCLSYIGNYSALITSLENPEKVKQWDDCIQELRSAIARSDEQARKVRTSLMHYAQQPQRMYAMLWKYDAIRLSRPLGLELVEALNHDTLAIRILADWNLRRMRTGGKAINYLPTAPVEKRSESVERWKKYIIQNTNP